MTALRHFEAPRLSAGGAVRAGYLPGITTIILTLDEEIHIARAIANAQAFSREVLVVDSFSRDRTVDIARSMGARVVQNAWVNYARQFRFALEECGVQTEWILRLDADELIGPELAKRMELVLPTLTQDVTGIVLNRRHVFMGKWIRHGGRYPLHLLRVWRNGLGEVEDRWMDEHVRVRGGRTIALPGLFEDANLRDIAFFVAKHNGYAAREALDVLGKRHGLFAEGPELTAANSGEQAGLKRHLKAKVYNRLPFGIGPLAYFLYRYVFQLGFLDGRAGLVYHLMQGFWYRFLVDVRVLELEQAIRSCVTPEEKRAALRDATGLKL
ncbi:glycosyltransferase family 2 protein [Novosphingobium sp. RD2P27]|uniref:Glycosyltransferase family 2 protein n=1 Tax=Novosphingobium kalidii TaxID=3230299 RepID=A0ABV2CZW6_9SPHN